MTTGYDEHVGRLANLQTAEALVRAELPWKQVDAHACAALRMQSPQAGFVPIVGLVGGASSGKSTLFNSLIGCEASLISAHAHETLGPIIAVHARREAQLSDWLERGLLFGGFKPLRISQPTPTGGASDAVHFWTHDCRPLEDVLLCDLPDVTSQSSAQEGEVTRNLLPYFDGLVVVVDEERWFDAAVFEDFLTFARTFAPQVLVVFNRTEPGSALSAEERARLAEVAGRGRASGHCICPYQPGSGYRPVAAETRAELLAWMHGLKVAVRRRALADYLRDRANAVIAENLARAERFERLLRRVDDRLAEVAADTSLTLDLLTAEEKRLLGVGHRFVPLYDLARQVSRRVAELAGRPRSSEVDFEKPPQAMAEVLGRNLEMRCDRATNRIDELTATSGYFPNHRHWENTWAPPVIDTDEWAQRIRAHIVRWKDEAKSQGRKGDLAAISIGTPLLVADLLFLGGTGTSAAWAVAWVAGFLGSKGLVRLMQRSPAYAEYQTTVKAYQALVRESLAAQWQDNVARMPRRHLAMSDPLMQALLYVSNPGRVGS